MPEPATAEEIAQTEEQPSWAVVWGLDGYSWFQDFLLTFGLSKSSDEALGRVEHTLSHGRARPPTTADEFRKKVQGGRFFTVAVHMGLPVVGESFKNGWPHREELLYPHSVNAHYATLWKRDGESEMRLVKPLATAQTAEEMLKRAEFALGWDWFHRMHTGGAFYPIYWREFVAVPGPDGELATKRRS